MMVCEVVTALFSSSSSDARGRRELARGVGRCLSRAIRSTRDAADDATRDDDAMRVEV